MTRASYKSVLRAKGIKPIRRAAHTVKRNGDVELLPVRGVHIHDVPAPLGELIDFGRESAILRKNSLLDDLTWKEAK
jgi:hypothetical protein